ncbi:MAG: ATP-binding protein [Thermoanaerobaculia bacterium]
MGTGKRHASTPGSRDLGKGSAPQGLRPARWRDRRGPGDRLDAAPPAHGEGSVRRPPCPRRAHREDPGDTGPRGSGRPRECLVNAVYHRSYEGEPEPTKVYLYPDRMEIINYPGPMPGIEREHFRPGAGIPPVPARNRRIGELLKELRLAEARGTGVPKVFRAMENNGSPPPRFDFDDARTYFRVTLPAHPEHPARS